MTPQTPDPMATLIGEAWLADDLEGDALYYETNPRPTVQEYAGFATRIAARLRASGVRGPEDGLRDAAQRVVDAYMGPAEHGLLMESDILTLRAALRSTPAAPTCCDDMKPHYHGSRWVPARSTPAAPKEDDRE